MKVEVIIRHLKKSLTFKERLRWEKFKMAQNIEREIGKTNANNRKKKRNYKLALSIGKSWWKLENEYPDTNFANIQLH